MSRSQNILGRIRLKLGQISPQKVQDEEIYYLMQQAQNAIIKRTKCLEASAEVVTVKDQENYLAPLDGIMEIKNVFTSWGGDVEFVANNDFDRYKGATGSYPAWATLFNKSLYLAPVPVTDGDKITIWAYKSKASTEINKDAEPEIPAELDEALYLGVMKEFDDSYIPKYEQELMTAPVNIKQRKNTQVNSTW
jgi:hypothetical protein